MKTMDNNAKKLRKAGFELEPVSEAFQPFAYTKQPMNYSNDMLLAATKKPGIRTCTAFELFQSLPVSRCP